MQIAIARLLGYRWPAELDEAMRLSRRAKELVQRCADLLTLADADGIVCVPPVRGEQPAADRLQRLLAQAFGTAWSPATLPALLEQAGGSAKPLDDWLRDGFSSSTASFSNNGRSSGISGMGGGWFRGPRQLPQAEPQALERLTYYCLGDWITPSAKDARAGKTGARTCHSAAPRTPEEACPILEGEPPYDIFVRWKPLHRQPIGWEPDSTTAYASTSAPSSKPACSGRTPTDQVDQGPRPAQARARGTSSHGSGRMGHSPVIG